MAEFEPGKMDVTTHEKGYDAFWNMTVRIASALAVILLLMYFFLL